MANRLHIPLPTRCLLHQALLWIAEEFPPIDDRVFMSLPDRSWATVKDEHKRDLLLALRSGTLKAEGVLWVTSGPRLRIEDQCAEIEGNIWEWDKVEWENSILWVDRTQCARDGKEWKCHSFEAITVPTAELLATFPSEKHPKPLSLDPPSRAKASRRGRPPKFDWPTFYVEIAVRADLDNLPHTQAELERDMAEWCSQNWEDVPGESTLRVMLSPIYSHHRRARK